MTTSSAAHAIEPPTDPADPRPARPAIAPLAARRTVGAARLEVAAIQDAIAFQMGMLDRVLTTLGPRVPDEWRASLIADLVHSAAELRRGAEALDLRDLRDVAARIFELLQGLAERGGCFDSSVLRSLAPMLTVLPDVLAAELDGGGLDPVRFTTLLDRLETLRDALSHAG